MNYILSLIKQMPKSSKNRFYKSLIQKKLSSSSLIILSEQKNNNNNNKQSKDLSNNSSLILKDNESYLITFDNFQFSHICNRDIRDLPLPKRNDMDFDRLRSCYILTMTDLIGRYLIHKTSDEFGQFLIEKVQCSQSFTDEIIQLIDIWTLHNLKVGRGTRTTILKQYL
ncbi:unnamed protein product [Adineta steineri]|uniref:Uncharacterized protein n=1 Tax=Adineta steineri TaxID=433720 RepID=A0A814M5K0_9BILA|nr:unnamed protein product [Adineta steineri]CAF1283589.1 unnamed protein product [Adineta steineri]